MATLSAVTSAVPSLRTMRSHRRLETIVPAQMTIETMPAYETGTEKSPHMTGHAAPSSESGRPRLIKAR